jgi:hypothetical protein
MGYSEYAACFRSSQKEWGNLEFPGIYILVDPTGKKVYIGEAKDI